MKNKTFYRLFDAALWLIAAGMVATMVWWITNVF